MRIRLGVAIAFVVVLASAAAACGGRVESGSGSGSSSGNGSAAATPPSSRAPSSAPTRSPRPDPGDEPEPDPESDTCPSHNVISEAEVAKAIGASAVFKGPRARLTACSDEDMTAFESSLKTASTINDLQTSLSSECKACVFTKVSAEAWGPIVVLESSSPVPSTQDGFVNYGACFAAVSGDMSCGKTVQYDQFCISNACSMCGSSAAVGACYREASKTTCKGTHDAILTSCPQTGATTCGANLVEHVRYLCAMK